MIRSVHIQNYRSLRDVRVELEPLTVFVGANASGKSSFFAALQGHYRPGIDVWRRVSGTQARVAMVGPETAPSWSGTSGGLQRHGDYPRIQLLALELNALRQHEQVAERRVIDSTGLGLAGLFQTLTRKQRDAISQQFCALVPMFADVDGRPSHSGQHRMVFQDRWQSEVWYEPEQVSDGSILLLAYLMVQHQSPAPDLIAIEEPERGLHPYLMNELVKTLRNLAHGRLGKPVQVILATHSAQLLDAVEPKEVRFFSRTKDTGETKVEAAPIDSPDWKKIFTEYNDSLGGVWLAGGLGGVP